MKQHHGKVVLCERMPALCGGPEVKPRLDMVAYEPGRPGPHEIRIGGSMRLGAGAARARKQQEAEPLAHVMASGEG